MITIQMPVNGFCDLYIVFFNSIVRTFGEDGFTTLLRLSELLAGFTVLMSLVLHRDLLALVKWLFYFYILIYVAFLPKTSLEIVDQITGKPNRVDNVPLGLAITASTTASLSYYLTELLEKNFIMPDDLKYQKYGMVFSAQVMKALTQFEITDPTINNNMQGFIERCMFYDIWYKKYSLKDLVSTDNIWDFLATQKMSPVRGMMYTDRSKSETRFLTCADAYPKLQKDWQEAINLAKGFYGTRLFGNKISAIEMIDKYLPVSYGFLTKLAQKQSDLIMKQAMMSNAIERGVVRQSAKVNADAAINSYSYVRAQAQMRLTNQTVGEMACYWLPLIKVSLELILYGSFIFVILIAVFPFGQRSLKGYLATLLWVQIWPPVFALFHLIASYYGQSQISSAVSDGVTMQNMTSLNQLASDMVGLAGYMSMSVPALAAFILWGSHHYLGQISQYVGGVTQSASSQAASEMSSGNISLGNTSFGNHNALNTSSNKFDTNMRAASGASSLQLQDGSQLTHMAAGNSVLNMQGAISSTPVQIDLSENYRSSLMRGAEHAESTAKQNMETYGHSVSAVSRDVNQLSHHVAQMGASGESWSNNASSGTNIAFSEIEKVNQEISQKMGLSHQESEALVTSLYGEAKGHLGFSTSNVPGKIFSASIGAGGGISRTSSNSDSNALSHGRDQAKAIMDAHHYSENVDIVSRAIQDKSFRVNSEDGRRLAKEISHSKDIADSSRHDANVNLQKADYFRKTASLTSESGTGFRENLNQEFVEYIANLPNTNGTGPIGVENVSGILSDSHMREHYAREFLEDKVSALEDNWQHGLPKNSLQVEKIYHTHSHELGNDKRIENIHAKNIENDAIKGAKQHLNLDDGVNSTMKNDVIDELAKNNIKVHEKRAMLQQEKRTTEEEHNKVMKDYKRGWVIANEMGITDPEEKK